MMGPAFGRCVSHVPRKVDEEGAVRAVDKTSSNGLQSTLTALTILWCLSALRLRAQLDSFFLEEQRR